MNGRSQYTVSVVEWSLYTLQVEAGSETDALERAEANWDLSGPEDWKHRDNGLDDFTVIGCRPLPADLAGGTTSSTLTTST